MISVHARLRHRPRPARALGKVAALSAVLALAFVFPLASAGKDAGTTRKAVRCFGLAATKVGTSRGELIRGSSGRDVIFGGAGNDIVLALGGDDVVCGGAGNDRVQGGDGNDRISGGPGHDFLDAENGTVQIVTGGAGTDLCLRGSRTTGCERGGPPTDAAPQPPCLVPGCTPSATPARNAAVPSAVARPTAAKAVGSQLLGVVTCLVASWSSVESRQFPPAVTAANRTHGVDREYVWWWSQQFEYNVLFGGIEPVTTGTWARALATDYEYTDDFYRYDNGALVGHWFTTHFPSSATLRYWKNWLYWPQPNGTWEYTFHWGANERDGYAQGC